MTNYSEQIFDILIQYKLNTDKRRCKLTLGQLLVKAMNANPVKGNIEGTCVVCGNQTGEGIRVNDTVSDNFTGWSFLFSGNCMCSDCYFIFSDQVFRRKSWVVSLSEGFRAFKNDEAIEVLFNPPEPPFFIYIAKIGQKQGWLSCLHKVAWSKSKYFLAHEKYDVPVMFDRDIAFRYCEQIKRAFELGISKTEMLEGSFSATNWKKAIHSGYDSFLREISKNKRSLLWEVMVDVSRKDRGREGETVDRASGLFLQCG